MIEKEKSAFEGFNANVLSDYKAKMREVEAQKEHLNDMEIQVHKNIHLLELAEGQMRATGTKLNPRPSTAASNVENHRNRSNTELSSKLQQTKGRFREMENFARQINVETHEERERMKEKVNLSGYITRVNRALSKY
jgi:DNA anti-recombination protein RmuC